MRAAARGGIKMTNEEANFRCLLAYEQLDKIYTSLCHFKRIEDAEELLEIMRRLIVYSQRFCRESEE